MYLQWSGKTTGNKILITKKQERSALPLFLFFSFILQSFLCTVGTLDNGVIQHSAERSSDLCDIFVAQSLLLCKLLC